MIAVAMSDAPATTAADLPEGRRRLWRGERWTQLVVSALILAAAWINIRPLGLTGLAGLTTLLLVLNTAGVLLRHPTVVRIPDRWQSGLLTAWTVVAVALLAVSSASIAPAFAYLVAGSAGYRLPARISVPLASGSSIASALAVLLLDHAGVVSGWPWYLGFTVGLPVFLGIANRSRDRAVESALAAAAADRRAARAEAREAALAERARISRDIHDVLAHTLSGVGMQLELADLLLEQGDVERARAAVGTAHSLVREGTTEAGRAVRALRSDALPLRETLAALFDGTSDLTVTGSAREPATEVAQTVVRIAQEALTNARRHAPGGLVRARLVLGDGAVQLWVENGPGGAGSGAGSGMGLVGMRERAGLLGGRVDAGPLTVGPLSGGWSVHAELPG
ncbi:two-component sensor histidine kinase [Nakamurella sp. YIM 132087]|uniref:histidine kinase n=1 Tax=Nakamurella alba TaxID=2665158 RepID=A0A7K1FPM6_9ACTN|nr:histidine kinase [Nakamurella alba]MTD16081.1 two-component sensor histidine kinase [Nakamurella alba]